MLWEELTMPDFVKLRDESGVCLVSIGCLEKHGHHLPLGIDAIEAHELCRRAATIESAVVFPRYYFGQISEAKCFPGTIAFSPTQILELLLAVLDEIGRNGFKKIIIVNGHGGNNQFLRFLLFDACHRKRDYLLYLFDFDKRFTPEQRKAKAEMIVNNFGGHAHEAETSVALALVGHLVKMQDILPDEMGAENQRLKPVMQAISATTFDWFSMYPEHYAGNARLATKEKGETLINWAADNLARAIKVVKDDTVSASVRDEFFERVDKL